MGKPSIIDKILDRVQFDLGKDANPAVIYDHRNRIYKRLEKERVQWLEAFCKTDTCQQTIDDVLKKAASNNIDEGGGDKVNQDMFIQKERTKKARKLAKGLHQFTGVALEGERKCKGWSNEGMEAFEKYVKMIKKDVEDGK